MHTDTNTRRPYDSQMALGRAPVSGSGGGGGGGAPPGTAPAAAFDANMALQIALGRAPPTGVFVCVCEPCVRWMSQCVSCMCTRSCVRALRVALNGAGLASTRASVCARRNKPHQFCNISVVPQTSAPPPPPVPRGAGAGAGARGVSNLPAWMTSGATVLPRDQVQFHMQKHHTITWTYCTVHATGSPADPDLQALGLSPQP